MTFAAGVATNNDIVRANFSDFNDLKKYNI